MSYFPNVPSFLSLKSKNGSHLLTFLHHHCYRQFTGASIGRTAPIQISRGYCKTSCFRGCCQNHSAQQFKEVEKPPPASQATLAFLSRALISAFLLYYLPGWLREDLEKYKWKLLESETLQRKALRKK